MVGVAGGNGRRGNHSWVAAEVDADYSRVAIADGEIDCFRRRLEAVAAVDGEDQVGLHGARKLGDGSQDGLDIGRLRQARRGVVPWGGPQLQVHHAVIMEIVQDGGGRPPYRGHVVAEVVDVFREQRELSYQYLVHQHLLLCQRSGTDKGHDIGHPVGRDDFQRVLQLERRVLLLPVEPYLVKASATDTACEMRVQLLWSVSSDHPPTHRY